LNIENFKYIKNVSEDEGTMLLYSQIGDSIDENGNVVYGISGSSFANELQWLQTQCKSISVRINSVGGSVYDGYSIASAILNSKVPCNTYVDGLAASMAGVISLCGKKRKIKDFASWMGHEAMGSNDEKISKIATDSLVTLIANNINKTESEVLAMLTKEVWVSNSKVADYSLEQAVEMGFFDEIESTKRKVKINKSSLYEMANTYNKLINQKNKTMNKVIDFLKLKNEASEEDVVNAIENKDKELASKDEEIAALTTRLKKYEDAEKVAKDAALEDMKNKATELVNANKELGKCTEEEVEGLISLAITNFSTVENMFSKISNVKNNNNPIFNFKVKNAVGEVEDRSKWTFSEWSKNDEKGLMEMQNSFPEQFNELLKTLKTTL